MVEFAAGMTIYKKSDSDAANKNHTNMIKYYNFLLTKERELYFRQRFNFMMILGEVGGAQSFILQIILFLLGPLYYKRHHLKIY